MSDAELIDLMAKIYVKSGGNVEELAPWLREILAAAKELVETGEEVKND